MDGVDGGLETRCVASMPDLMVRDTKVNEDWRIGLGLSGPGHEQQDWQCRKSDFLNS